ncbi:MAG: FAD-dependent oxidoreductase [Lachnospiraceae bacterium]|nr:FAD-dependent oxidoreductase [Lachnospiraceae bacterium]
MLDLLIIGSGPAGLSASIYAKRANLKFLVAEKEYLGTGQIAESMQVDNYIGHVGSNGYDLGEIFRQDAEKLGVEFYEAQAVQINHEKENWITLFDNGETIESRTIIYAAGATHRRLQIPGEDTFRGKGVSYCAICDGAFFQDKTVAVIGGGDTALDDALYLSDIASKVYLIHRRNEFRGSENNVLRVKSKENIELVLSANAVEVKGEEQVSSLVLDNGREISVNGVFVAIGMEPQSKLLENLVVRNEDGYIVADETGKTTAPGIFAAGDVRTKKLRQVVTAVADGANAVISSMEYIKKD